MKKALDTVRFEEIKDKAFEVIRVVEKLCEICDKPLSTEKRTVRTVQISQHRDYENLLTRARAHDRVEVDLEESKIYLYDHDYPGDLHPSCLDKL